MPDSERPVSELRGIKRVSRPSKKASDDVDTPRLTLSRQAPTLIMSASQFTLEVAAQPIR